MTGTVLWGRQRVQWIPGDGTTGEMVYAMCVNQLSLNAVFVACMWIEGMGRGGYWTEVSTMYCTTKKYCIFNRILLNVVVSRVKDILDIN